MRLLRYFGLAAPLRGGSGVLVIDMDEVIVMLRPDATQFEVLLHTLISEWGDWSWVG